MISRLPKFKSYDTNHSMRFFSQETKWWNGWRVKRFYFSSCFTNRLW